MQVAVRHYSGTINTLPDSEYMYDVYELSSSQCFNKTRDYRFATVPSSYEGAVKQSILYPPLNVTYTEVFRRVPLKMFLKTKKRFLLCLFPNMSSSSVDIKIRPLFLCTDNFSTVTPTIVGGPSYFALHPMCGHRGRIVWCTVWVKS